MTHCPWEVASHTLASKMKKILLSSLLILTLALAGFLFWRAVEGPLTPQVAVITLSEKDLTSLGQDPAKWEEDLATLRALFESFGPVSEQTSPTEQVASIPPELYILGPSLEAMRARAQEETQQAQALAQLLENQARRRELFLPIRALALTHLVLLGRRTQVSVDYESFDPEVRALADVVLQTP